MKQGLLSKKIAITGSRKTEELSVMIERQGASVCVLPMQGLVQSQEASSTEELHTLLNKGSDWLIFTTGIGLNAMLTQLQQLGREDEFLALLKQNKVASRGYKTLGLLKKLQVEPLAVDDDGTSEGLIRVLSDELFEGKRVAVQLHGGPMPALVQFLEGKGAKVHTLLPYIHIPPDEAVASELVRQLLADELDAVCFTTAVQVRYLFDYAREQGVAEELKQSFAKKAVATAVGRVTADALKVEGITRIVVPEQERMGTMVMELVRHFAQ